MRLIFCSLWACTSLLCGVSVAEIGRVSPAIPAASASTQAESGFAIQTQGWKKHEGLFATWTNEEQARLMMAVPRGSESFIFVTSLPAALGSNDVGLDRGQAGSSRLLHFERHGKRLFLLEENTRFTAQSNDADERAAVREAFASAVIWSGDIVASENNIDLIDFTSFIVSDRHGVAASLQGSKQGNYTLDEKRSALLFEHTKNFPDNTEFEALLSFTGPGEGTYVRQVAADPKSLALHQHLSLIRLPQGFQARAYHPASGGFDVHAYDFAKPLASDLHQRLQVRFRLEKTDPSAALSPVKKPIVFYLDRGTPEPVRSALLEGARWWIPAFEKAGFKDAYRVELLPEGADAMDVRFNTIMWVHRATRGWSYGNAVSDPRTGEIIKGSVSLGSQRVRQDIMIAEGLLAPYGAHPDQAKKSAATEMALARLRQLAAHEVGHALGIAHNFAASRAGNGSVMDYPHPLVSIVSINQQHELALSQTYGVGVGPWDDYVIQHLYAQFSPETEQAGLAQLRAAAKAQGLRYVGDNDSRSIASFHPDGVLWDYGVDSIASLDHIMAVRKIALNRFSIAVLPDDRQLGELEARLVPIYLLHRYQTEAVAHLIGGAEFEYGFAQDVNAGRIQSGTQSVSAQRQRLALNKILSTLHAENLVLPEQVLKQLSPQSEGYSRTAEYFSNRMNGAFDALSSAQAAASHTCQLVLDASRINRVAWQQASDHQQLSVQEMMRKLFENTWQYKVDQPQTQAAQAVQLAANWVLVDTALNLLDAGRLHPQVDAEVRLGLQDWATWLQKNAAKNTLGHNRKQAAEFILAYLRDPHSIKLRPLPNIPPGAPI